jgi:hypothetical protein
VLDPHVFPYLTDRRVLAAGRAVSDNGRFWYTAHQLVGQLASRRRVWRWTRRLTVAQLTVMTAAVDGLRRHGWPFPGLIVAPAFDLAAPVGYPEPDLFDYGAERILIVDDPLLVDLLVRNGVHTDARSVIVSITGYPRQVVARAATLVEQRPDVPAYVLHASHHSTEEMAVAAGELLGAPHLTPFDVGLSPLAADRIAPIRWARRLPSIPVDALPRRWVTTALVDALTTNTPLEQLEDSDEDRYGGDFG